MCADKHGGRRRGRLRGGLSRGALFTDIAAGPEVSHALVCAVGGANGLVAYCYRKAIAISLSRTALFAFWDDLLAMGLSYGLLHEGQFLNARLLLGIGLSVGAVIGFTVNSTHAPPTSAPVAARPPRRRYLYTGAYSLLVGGGVFFMRYLG